MLSSKMEITRFEHVSKDTCGNHTALPKEGPRQEHPGLPKGPLRSAQHMVCVPLWKDQAEVGVHVVQGTSGPEQMRH